MIALADAVRAFTDLLQPREGNAERLQQWITAVRVVDPPHLHAFTRGLDPDLGKDAIEVAVSLPSTTAEQRA